MLPQVILTALWHLARSAIRRLREKEKRDMWTLIIEVIAAVPTVAGIARSTLTAYEAATDSKTKFAAVVTGLQGMAAEVQRIIDGMD